MRRLSALVLGIALSTLGAELAVRLSRAELRLLEPLVPRQVFEPAVHQALPDAELLYGLRPGLALTLPPACPWSDAPRRVHTNALGFRDPERARAKPAGTYRILAVGSSNTFGPCVSDEETWPAQLEVALNRGSARRVEVWNLGVSGYMTRQAAALAARVAPAVDADLVILQVYNVGRRFLYVDQPLEDALAVDPRLWGEYLGWAPAPGDPRFALFRRLAIWRFGVVALNRALWESPTHDPLPGRIEAGRAADQAAVDALAAVVRLGILIPPPGAEAPEGARTLDLSAFDWDAEGREIHPGAGVYKKVAELVAENMREFGDYQR